MNKTFSGWGLWALPVGGLLTLIPWLGLLVGRGADPSRDPGGFARAVTSPGVILLGDLYIIGTICLLFGVLALYVVLAETRGGSWAAAGALAGVIAMVIVVALWTILTFGDAIVGDVYLSGHHDAGETFKWMSGGHWNGRIVPLLAALVVSGVVGAVGLGVAIWRSGRFAKWIAVAFALAFFLEAASSPPTLIGAILMVVTGFFIAREAGSRPTIRAAA